MSDKPDDQAGSDFVTQDQFKEFKAKLDQRLDASEAQTADHEARITVLEGGAVDPPDPPDPGEASPDGTEATAPGTVLVSAGLNTFELCAMANTSQNYGIKYNGTLDAATHHVSRLYAEGGVVFQQAGGYWYASQDDGTWRSASDPTQETPVPPDPPDPPAEGYGPNIVGAYVASAGNESWNYGNGADKDALMDQAVSTFESEIGVPVNAYLTFTLWGGIGWWDDNLRGVLSAMRNNSTKCSAPGFVPIVSLKPFWNGQDGYGWNDPQGFKDTADGKWDATWRGCVDACADNGYNVVIFRLHYESNQGFMPDFAGYSAEAQQTIHTQSFEHMADVLHDQARQRGIVALVAFNPTCGRGGCSVEDIEPRRDCLDIYACDLYNGIYLSPGEPGYDTWKTDPEVRKNFWRTMYYGTNHHLANAKRLGLPIMILECGAGQRPDQCGTDNSDHFWDFVAEWAREIRSQSVRFCGIGAWNIPAGDIAAWMSYGKQPACIATIKRYMQDGTLIGDPLWEPADATAARAVQAAPARALTEREDLRVVFTPPDEPLEIEPAKFNGRDHRAIKAWRDALAELLEERGKNPRPSREA